MASSKMRGLLIAWLPAAVLWTANALWLMLDTRPPSWDMAVHQNLALNYLPGGAETARGTLAPWSRSDNYPPFVHLAIAFCFLVFHPGTHIGILANVPATLLLFWAVYELASELAGDRTAAWACVLAALVPYLIWMSRETILDYWLSALVAASLVLLRRTRGFESHSASLLLGGALAVGLLSKWLFAAFMVTPILYVCIVHRVWRYPVRLIHLADSLLIAGVVSGLWYVPNAPGLVRYFSANAEIGAREGEPPVLSFQSLVYYLRLLEGYQLFALLFVLVSLACIIAVRKRVIRDGGFLAATIAGGWLFMTLLRTKDPRFTMPLLGLLMIYPAAWLQAWKAAWHMRATKGLIVALLCLQAYAASFGVSWLPEKIVIAKGYQGSLRWDWNLYLQEFYILGRPRREDWKQADILREIGRFAEKNKEPVSLAVIPDLPRFNAANINLMGRLIGMRIHVDHPQSAANGIHSFDGFNYVLMTERDQGMPWTTASSKALNQIVVDEHEMFRLIDLYPLPNGDSVRLYFIRRDEKAVG